MDDIKAVTKTLKKEASTRVLLITPLSSKTCLLKRALTENNYILSEQISDISKILESTELHQPDIIMVNMDRPDTGTLKRLSELRIKNPLPVIVFAEKDSPDMINQVIKSGVNAFIVDDIQIQRLPSIVNIAIARFNEQQRLELELSSIKSKLADRKIIDKAKGLLMSEKNMSEDQAYKTLRKMAMNKGQSMTIISENLIDAFTLLN